jgi:hypothetical protein
MSQPDPYGCQYIPRMIMSADHFHVQQAVSRAKGTRPEQEDPLSTTKFEQDLWQEYGLIGDVDPEHLLKECQRKAREAEDETLQKITTFFLNALDTIHKFRKQPSHSFVLRQEGIWPEAEEALPNDQSVAKTIGQKFWAVLIGNNKYTDGKLEELYGAIKFTQYDALLNISQVALTTLNWCAIICLST